MNRRQFLDWSAVSASGLVAAGVASESLASSTKNERIKIGQIGTTHAHASGKLATIRKFSDVYELVGVVEPNKKRRNSLANNATYRDVKWMTEEELLSSNGLQAVAVETSVRDLVPTAARCISAGVHIHLDKPAGESLSEFKKVLDAATSKNLVVQMGYMFRYNPGFQFMFRAVKDGWLGDVFELHAVISKTVGDSTRQQLAQFEGGSMFELGCHLIDAVVAVMGRPDNVTPFIRHTQPDKDKLADNMLAVFEYPRATATVRSALMEVDGFRRRQFVVCGNRGTIAIRPLEAPVLELTLDKAQGKFKKGSQFVELPKLEGRYDGDFADLAKIIRGEKSSDYPPAHDLAVQEAVLKSSGMSVE